MTVTIESILFLGPDIAVEKGIAKVKLADESAGARYTVVHARRDGKWTMVVGRDAPYVPGTNEDYLKDLEWLIGDWTLAAKDSPLKLHFEWMAQRNFIKNTYTVTKDGKSTLTGGQIIGWNPKLGHIVSWHFDAEGGFGDDAWIQDGSKWVIEAKGVFRNGSESHAVNVLTPIDANSFTWQSLKRTLDGVAIPDVGRSKWYACSPPSEAVLSTGYWVLWQIGNLPHISLKGLWNEQDNNQSDSWNCLGAVRSAIRPCARFRRRPRRQRVFRRRDARERGIRPKSPRRRRRASWVERGSLPRSRGHDRRAQLDGDPRRYNGPRRHGGRRQGGQRHRRKRPAGKRIHP